MVGADRPTALGDDVTEFEGNGHTGLQCVRFDLEGGDGDDERTIRAVATLAVPRPIPPYGPVTLVARSETVFVEPLATALVPLQYLLTSDAVVDLVRGQE